MSSRAHTSITTLCPVFASSTFILALEFLISNSQFDLKTLTEGIKWEI